jgi:hypothetical protein
VAAPVAAPLAASVAAPLVASLMVPPTGLEVAPGATGLGEWPGQNVVVRVTTSVVSCPSGQLVTVGGQEVTV